ncbi:cell envelope biogenesis protein TolA [Bradyrhizobium sp. NAS80.1]|uniref:cell envelope biogenesis protein TolA n=1 Tax=Bradyrhizobium sp. NAS80.1 TaxID=1680159 RepID=UPI0032DFFB54
MKAALEAWGAGSNLFHQGIAEETDDPEVVAATLAKPGVVLKRPAGSNGRFAEHSGLPSEMATDKIGHRPKAGQAKPKQKPEPEHRASATSRDKEATRKAAASSEREQARREAQIRQEEAALARKREQRQKLIAKAQAAFENAEREHEARAAALEAERAAVEERAQAEEARWFRQKEKLTAVLRQAREQ